MQKKRWLIGGNGKKFSTVSGQDGKAKERLLKQTALKYNKLLKRAENILKPSQASITACESWTCSSPAQPELQLAPCSQAEAACSQHMQPRAQTQRLGQRPRWGLSGPDRTRVFDTLSWTACCVISQPLQHCSKPAGRPGEHRGKREEVKHARKNWVYCM